MTILFWKLESFISSYLDLSMLKINISFKGRESSWVLHCGRFISNQNTGGQMSKIMFFYNKKNKLFRIFGLEPAIFAQIASTFRSLYYFCSTTSLFKWIKHLI